MPSPKHSKRNTFAKCLMCALLLVVSFLVPAYAADSFSCCCVQSSVCECSEGPASGCSISECTTELSSFQAVGITNFWLKVPNVVTEVSALQPLRLTKQQPVWQGFFEVPRDREHVSFFAFPNPPPAII